MDFKQEYERLDKKYWSATHYVLTSLLPYAEANIKLSFKPSMFFNDLEKLDRVKSNKKALKGAYYRAINNGYIEFDDKNNPRLTEKGHRKIKPYKPKKLRGSSLMVIFDIPEDERHKRDRLRILLKELSFKQVQKSVWESRLDSRQYLRAEISALNLQDYVKVYESAQIEI